MFITIIKKSNYISSKKQHKKKILILFGSLNKIILVDKVKVKDKIKVKDKDNPLE